MTETDPAEELHPISADRETSAEMSTNAALNVTEDLETGAVPHPPALEALSVSADKRPTLVTIEDLPNELLANIFGYFDITQPSVSALYDEPIFELTDSETTDLKAVSCVSKRWRLATLPVLFKHARFIASETKTHKPVLNKQIQPFLDFVTRNSLSTVIASFALLIQERKIASDLDEPYRLNGFKSFWLSVFKVIDPVELLIVAPAEALGALCSCHVILGDSWSFDCPFQYLRLQRPPTPPTNSPVADKAVPPSDYLTADPPLQVVEPLTSTFSVDNVPEDLLTHKASSEKLLTDAPKSPRRASQPEASSSSSATPAREIWEFPRSDSSELFETRPWSTLLLNEGSFIRAYATYEFWLRQPPSILADLVGADAPPHAALISPTIRNMEYIGIFPMASHFAQLTKHCPRLDRLYVQLVPRNDILEIPSKMVQVETEDLWMERNSCYALLMRELFNAPPVQNYKYLQVFESGDAADTDAWHMAVEYVKRAGNGWKVASDGVFVRDPEDLVPEPKEGDDSVDPSIFQGALIRWAWNGITKLPVSAYPLYDQPLGPLS